MKETDLLRRHFTLFPGTLIAGRLPLHGASALTVQDVVERIRTSLGGEWPPAGPDGFKAGDPNTPVKGIATTAMATLDVLKQASKAGTNLVITYAQPMDYLGRAGRGLWWVDASFGSKLGTASPLSV